MLVSFTDTFQYFFNNLRNWLSFVYFLFWPMGVTTNNLGLVLCPFSKHKSVICFSDVIFFAINMILICNKCFTVKVQELIRLCLFCGLMTPYDLRDMHVLGDMIGSSLSYFKIQICKILIFTVILYLLLMPLHLFTVITFSFC